MTALLFVWLASVIGSVAQFFNVVGWSCLTILATWTFWWVLDNTTGAATLPVQKKLGKWLIAVGIMCLLVKAVLPNEKTMYFMAGAYMGQTALQSEAGQKIGKIVNKKLETYLEELENNVKSTVQVPVQPVKE